jgi:lipoate-protein ligase A
VVDGKKISGNAQAWHKNKMLHHGTILFDANLAFVAEVLNVKPDKIESKGIKSNRARVTNIRPFLKEKLSVEDLKLHLIKALLNNNDISKLSYKLSEFDIERIREIQLKKYNQWSWNYGESPSSEFQKEKRFLGGLLQIHFNLNNGLISNLKIFGDFLGVGDTELISKTLECVKYNEIACREKLNIFLFNKIFVNISLDDFIECLF